jgi:hypothetical protein
MRRGRQFSASSKARSIRKCGKHQPSADRYRL